MKTNSLCLSLCPVLFLLLSHSFLSPDLYAAAQKDKDKDKVTEKARSETREKEKDKDKVGEEEKEKEAKTATLKPEEIKNFTTQPEPLQQMLRYALELAGRGLTYKSGSADPDLGGTDCSGFVYHLLQKHGHTAVPRQSDEMYQWTWKAGTFRACNGHSVDTFEFKELRPGDLLFWVNTLTDSKTTRNPPVTHVMIYLGERASDGRRLCAGASDGRTYDGQRMCGVSVFDFKLPAPGSPARFIGYAHLPEASQKVELEQSPAPKPPPSAQKPKTATPSKKRKPAPKTRPKTTR